MPAPGGGWPAPPCTSWSTRSRSSSVTSRPSIARTEPTAWIKWARYNGFLATGFWAKFMTTTWRRPRSFSSSANSATLFSDKCSARRRGKGPKFVKDLRPLSSIRNSLNDRSPSKECSSTDLILFLSSTNSRNCSMCERPSTFEISFPGKCRIRKVCNGKWAMKDMSVMPLKPSSRTCRCGNDEMPAWSSVASTPRSRSIFVRFNFSTSSFDKGPKDLMSETGFPSRLSSRNDGKMSSLRRVPSSRRPWLDKSTDRKL
mmetsp:Transcript_109167/g.314446  ORF Transcript_109167/g.314446 Transcript_109167/m.314446 type:complete len:258 (+) Transcript_109167:99-872(+)